MLTNAAQLAAMLTAGRGAESQAPSHAPHASHASHASATRPQTEKEEEEEVEEEEEEEEEAAAAEEEAEEEGNGGKSAKVGLGSGLEVLL